MVAWEEAREYLRDRPVAAVIIALLAAGYFSSCVFPLQQQLALIVANTLMVETYPWNIVTAHLYEHGFVKLLLDATCIALASRGVQAAQWDQFSLYIILSLVASGVGASLFRLLCFYIDQSQDHLTKAEWGAGALTIALAMYTRLEHATSPVTAYSLITYNHAVPVVVILNVLLTWLGLGADGTFSVFAFLFCWSYLRHLYRYPDGRLGERSLDTQFVKMFPPMAQPLVSIITTPIEKMCATMGIFGTDILDSTAESYLPRHHLRSRTTHESSGGSSPASATSHDPVKERRMQLARKMLEERKEVQQLIISPPGSM